MSRILVADDSTDLSAAIRAVLEREGHVVQIVSGGRPALRALEAAPQGFDLFLCDLMMPDGDGIETIQTARQLCPQLPILAMSGNSRADVYLHSARLLGAATSLLKPFGPAELIAACRSLLQAARPDGAPTNPASPHAATH